MEANGQSMKAVFTVIERGAGNKSIWMRVGVGFVNRDGSITLKLDALPVNGTLQVREWESREDGMRRGAGGSVAQDGDRDRDGEALLPRPRSRRDETSPLSSPAAAPPRRHNDASGGLV